MLIESSLGKGLLSSCVGTCTKGPAWISLDPSREQHVHWSVFENYTLCKCVRPTFDLSRDAG